MLRRTLLKLGLWAGVLSTARPATFGPAATGTGHGWLILDFDAVFCGGCFEPVLDFLRAVPAAVQETALTAVLVYAAASAVSVAEARRRIVEAKWDGLRRSQDWALPAFLDTEGDFRGWVRRRSARLIVFDGRTRAVIGHDLPLQGRRIDDILAVLID
ncbi:MAG: hypothetical protein NTZ26_12855 [Candidatus Aminicenantes bacterium]|nr:hypothetical protein [Candidatus Aminicenantes bacterium]